MYNWYNYYTTFKLSRIVSRPVDKDIYILPNFLNNYVRKGSGISNIEMREQIDTCIILKLLDNPGTLYNIHKRTGLNIQFVPKIDKNYISIVSYDKPGDSIDWHKDGNIYHGNRWAGILTIINEGNNNKKSFGKFLYKIDGGREKYKCIRKYTYII